MQTDLFTIISWRSSKCDNQVIYKAVIICEVKVNSFLSLSSDYSLLELRKNAALLQVHCDSVLSPSSAGSSEEWSFASKI